MVYGFGSYMMIWMVLCWILALAVIAGIVWLIVWAIRRASKHLGDGNGVSSEQTPEEIAKLRYARGEITRQEYQKIISDLKD